MSPQIAAALMMKTLRIESHIPEEQTLEGNTQGHMVWMLQALAAGDITGEKAHRWIGYAQGLAVMLGLGSLEDMKLINKDA